MSERQPIDERLRVLGLFAHPDDAEIWAGGTLINHSKLGDETTITTFDQGDAGRAAEAYAGAELLGANLRLVKATLDELTPSLIEEVVALLLDIEPNIMITHWMNDSHPQHRLIFDLTNRAVTKLRIATGLPQSLYSCDTYNSLGLMGAFDGNIYIDISDVWDQKLRAIDAHESQSGGNWKEMIFAQARLNGNRIGRTYAEAFCEVPVLGRFNPKTRLS